MIVISSSLVLSEPEQYTLNHPVVGYINLAIESAVEATTSADAYPIDNLTNIATYLKWIAEPADPDDDQYVTVDLSGTDDVDYLAIARHNMGTGLLAVSVEGALTVDSAGDPEWDELTAPQLVANDDPILFRFTRDTYLTVRLRIQPSTLVAKPAPEIAVLYVGALLTLQRTIYVSHRPINYARSKTITNGRSESGEFLGRFVLGSQLGSGFGLENLTPAWVRTLLNPFIAASDTTPFFFAWRPETYPNEVGFCWMTNDPQPENALSNGLMRCDFELGGLA